MIMFIYIGFCRYLSYRFEKFQTKFNVVKIALKFSFRNKDFILDCFDPLRPFWARCDTKSIFK